MGYLLQPSADKRLCRTGRHYEEYRRNAPARGESVPLAQMAEANPQPASSSQPGGIGALRDYRHDRIDAPESRRFVRRPKRLVQFPVWWDDRLKEEHRQRWYPAIEIQK